MTTKRVRVADFVGDCYVEIEEGDLVSDVVGAVKLVTSDGKEALILFHSEGCGAVTQLGLLHGALQVINNDPYVAYPGEEGG